MLEVRRKLSFLMCCGMLGSLIPHLTSHGKPLSKRKEKPFQLPTVPVEKSRPGQSPEEKEPTGFATVIQLKDQKRLRTLSEVLRESAGVNVRSSGGLGAWSTLSIRGSSPSQVQIVLDGVPLNHGGSGSINLSDLPLDILKQAVVYRGFAPAHLGGGMGGVVSLQTRWPKGYQSFQSSASAASFGTFGANVLWGQRIGKWRWLALAHYLGSVGSFPYYDNRGTPLQPADDLPNPSRQNNTSHTASTLSKVTFQPKRKVSLSLSHILVSRSRGVPGIGNFRSLSSKYSQLRNLLQFAAKGKQIPFRTVRWNTQLYVNHLWEGFSDRDGEIGLGRQETDNRTLLLGWKARAAWLPFSTWELSLAWHLRYEAFTPQNLLVPEVQAQERQRGTFEPSLESLHHLWDEKLTLVVSGRLNVLHNAYRDAMVLPDETTTTALYPTGRAGVRLRPWEIFWVQTNVGRYVRLPTFWELFGNRGTTIGNPTLKPEQGWMLDAGAVLHLKPTGALDELRLAYAFFASWSLDLIRFIQNSQRTVIAVNIDAAQVLGHEVRAKLGLFRCLRLEGDLTWMDARNQSNSIAERGKQLPGRPLWEVSLRTAFFLRWGQLYYNFTGLGGNYLDRANLKELAARQIHTIGVTIQPAEIARSLGASSPWTRLFLTLELRNLLDTRVASVPIRPALPNRKETPQALSDYSGYPLPGRAIHLTVQWKN